MVWSSRASLVVRSTAKQLTPLSDQLLYGQAQAWTRSIAFAC